MEIPDEVQGVLWLTVLGPVRAWQDGEELDLGSPQQRALLALLLACATRPLSISDLVEALWGGTPPASAVGVVHRYVSRLRRILEPTLAPRASGRWILRAGGGYRFAGDVASLDLLRFRHLVGEARARQDVSMFAEALEVPVGRAAATAEPGVRAHPLLAALDRELVGAAIQAADLALAQGVPGVVVGPVERIAALDPLDEAVQARVIRLLAAVGQRAAALDAYRATRGRLVGELGVEPGMELREAQRQALGDDDVSPVVKEPSVPAQLPADQSRFVGRAEVLDRITATVDQAGDAVAIAALSGMGGVGKTTVAVHWAHRAAHRYPDGQLYANLHGFDPSRSPLAPDDVLREFLEALGVPEDELPATLAERSALFRTRLASRRVLILLDDARSASQVRPLLPAAKGSTVVVTSRNRLTGLVAQDGAAPVMLDVLGPEEAHAFLVERLGAQRVAAEPDAVDLIAALCGGLPLALAIAAARAAVNPSFSLADLIADLRGGELDAFTTNETAGDLRSVFAVSYRALPPDAAELFRRLADHPGLDIPLRVAASVGAVPPRQAQQLLDHLVGAQLLGEHQSGRYAFHDLVRTFAAELSTQDPPEERRLVLRRTLDHYLRSAVAAVAVLMPNRTAPDLPEAADGVTPETFESPEEAVGWFDAERDVLLAIVEAAHEHGFDPYVWQLSWALLSSQHMSRRWHDAVSCQRLALDAAHRQQDDLWTGTAHHNLGIAYAGLEEWSAGERHHERAVRIFERLGDPERLANACTGVAKAATAVPPYTPDAIARSEAYNRRAVELYRSIGDAFGEGSVYNNSGWLQVRTGDLAGAITNFRRGEEVYRGNGHRYGEAEITRNLGDVYRRLGEYPLAIMHHRRSAELFGELRMPFDQANALAELGVSHRRAGHPDAALIVWERALDLLSDTDDPAVRRLWAELRSFLTDPTAAD